jgi:hypothetical protein
VRFIRADATALDNAQGGDERGEPGHRYVEVRNVPREIPGGLQQHIKYAATYRVGYESLEASADQVPGSWYVYQVAPLPDNVVVLWASADGKPPIPTHTGAASQPSSGPSTH